MRIGDKLESISSNETVAQIGEMLNQAHVSINWYGSVWLRWMDMKVR